MLCLLLVAVLPAEVDTVSSPVFSRELQTKAVLATVRLRNSITGGVGTGVVVGRKGADVYILTAAHVTNRATLLDVEVFTAESYPKPDRVYRTAEVVAQNVEGDLALVRLTTQDPFPVVRLCSPKGIPDGSDFPALSVGCDRDRPTVALETVKGKRLVRKPGDEQARPFWEAAAQARGRSGGPLLDRDGRVIGIASGVGEGKGYYVHPEAIHRFLRRASFAWLFEEGE